MRILINGEDLIDILRQVEMPAATQERLPDIAGAYEGHPIHSVGLSSLFTAQPTPLHQYDDKVEILVCASCGEPGCWPMLVRIDVREDEVVWSDFEQPHRSERNESTIVWIHDLGPFTFDRRQYEREVAKLAGGDA